MQPPRQPYGSLYLRATALVGALAHLAVFESALGSPGGSPSISQALGGPWTTPAALTLLSAVLVVTVVVLVFRARIESARHRQTERGLRESEARFRSVLSAVPDVILVLSAAGDIREIFTATPGLLVDPTDDLVGQNIHTRLPGAIASEVQAVIDRTIETGRTQTLEYPLTIGGHDKWFAAHTAPFGSTRDPCVLWVAREMTEQRQEEQRRRASEQKLGSIIDTASEAVIVSDHEGTITLWNKASEKIFGYTAEEAVGQPLRLIVPERFRAAHDAGIRRMAVHGSDKAGQMLDLTAVRKDGSEFPSELSFTVRGTGEGRFITEIVRDVTERQRARQDLLDSKEHLERRIAARTADLVTANKQLTAEIADRKRAEAIQSGWNRVLQRIAADAPLPEVLTVLVEVVESVQPRTLCSVLLLDQDTRRLRLGAAPSLPDFYNEAVDGLEIGPAAGSCGAAAFTGERVVVEDVMTHPYWVGFRDVARRAGLGACWSEPIHSSTGEILGTFAIYYRESRAPDQSAITLIASAAHLAGIAIERKQAEARLAESRERLRVSDRLASLGTLVAGLGHDMNNVLFPLRCRLDALNWDDLPDDVREVVKSSRDSVEYLQKLSSGLRLFAADPLDTEATLEITSPAAWWGQVQPLISKMVPKNVTIHADIPDDLPLITVAPHRLTQAVMNLVTNAAEAMPSGGEIHLRAKGDDAMHRVTITVSDKGIGMTDKVRRHALDPFFTTKKRTLSTGLGLSPVLGVVRRSHGMITIDSAPDKGTTVRLVFPTARVPGTARRRRNGAQDRAAVSLGDQRTAAWVTNVLESAGYAVSVAEDGDPRQSDIWVTEASAKNLSAARKFLTRHDQRRIIVMGSAGTAWTGLGAVVVEDASNLDAIKSAVCEVTPVPS